MARPRDDRQKDFLRPTLEEIIDMGHSLVRLAQKIDWGFLDGRFGSVCQPRPGQPGLRTRLVAGLPFDRSSLTRWRQRLGEEPLLWPSK
jgi:IS5 family transposase